MEENREELHLNTISDVIDDIASGKMVIVVDDANRENEGDVIMAAESCTEDNMNFLVKYARGLVCCPLASDIAERLKLDLMVERNTDLHGTAFTVSVDAMKGTTTGISAEDRAVTVRRLADPASSPGDFRRPGHMFPLIARQGGVLKRAGHTEAAVDLARLAGKGAACAICCEILNDDGSMARMPQLLDFAHRHGLKIVSVADLIKHRLSRENLVSREAEVRLPTAYGDFRAYAYRYLPDDESLVHLALVKGDLKPEDSVLVRVHSECITGDTFGSLRCDCGQQLHKAMRKVESEGAGVILYLRQEGRGIGLLAKLKAYELQERGLDTEDANIALGYPPDLRDYGVGAQILLDLGVRKIRLMTNNPRKVVGLEGYGLDITERVPLEFPANEHNEKYLQTKCCKMGHVLHLN